MAVAKKTQDLGIAATARALGIAGICTMSACFPATADPTPTTQEHIIWNDAQGAGAPAQNVPQVPTSTTPPIRDSFASSSGTGAAESAPRLPADDGIVWDQPLGKSTTTAKVMSNAAVSLAAGPCREFQQDVIIEGRPQKAHGRACRQPDGSWRIVN